MGESKPFSSILSTQGQVPDLFLIKPPEAGLQLTRLVIKIKRITPSCCIVRAQMPSNMCHNSQSPGEGKILKMKDGAPSDHLERDTSILVWRIAQQGNLRNL